VTITDDTLSVDLADGRSMAVPIAWYPRLLHGTPKERNDWRIIYDDHQSIIFTRATGLDSARAWGQ
jgi:hypothetical protein